MLTPLCLRGAGLLCVVLMVVLLGLSRYFGGLFWFSLAFALVAALLLVWGGVRERDLLKGDVRTEGVPGQERMELHPGHDHTYHHHDSGDSGGYGD